jgi:hypothetical protein
VLGFPEILFFSVFSPAGTEKDIDRTIFDTLTFFITIRKRVTSLHFAGNYMERPGYAGISGYGLFRGVWYLGFLVFDLSCCTWCSSHRFASPRTEVPCIRWAMTGGIALQGVIEFVLISMT